MEALFGSFLGPACVIQIKVVPPAPERPSKRIGFEDLLIFKGGEKVHGEVIVSPRGGRAVEHAGIKIEFIGQIEMLFGGGEPFEFSTLVKELEHPATLDRVKTFSFDFSGMEQPFESYDGLNVRVRYLLRVTLTRNMALNVIKEQDLWVINVPPVPEVFSASKTEVGVNGFLHIEVHLAREKFHLKEIIVGKIFLPR